MEEKDFCIGEEQVEKLFRELLKEPEPPKPVYDFRDTITAAEVGKLIEEVFGGGKIKNIFESDDAFYAAMGKNKK